MTGALHSLCQLGLGDSRNWLTNHICILQVSFVFTNQVDGKLVLIESVERSATHEPNEVAKVHNNVTKVLTWKEFEDDGI
jgi:hypothetical protein